MLLLSLPHGFGRMTLDDPLLTQMVLELGFGHLLQGLVLELFHHVSELGKGDKCVCFIIDLF